MNKRYFKYWLDLALMTSDGISEGCPAKIRPVVKLIVYMCTLGFLLILIPLSLPFSFLFHLLNRFKKPSISPFQRLQTEVQSMWDSESPSAALAKLRDIRQQLTQDLERLIKGISIAPYGTFRVSDYSDVLWLLYHYEMSHRNWDEANQVCDEVFERFLGGVKGRQFDFLRRFSSTEEWIVNKARVLSKCHGELAAQEYLLQYLDPDDQDSPVNTYFYELRQHSGIPLAEHKVNEPQETGNTDETEESKGKNQGITAPPVQTNPKKTNVVELPRHNDRV
jgi:hypothetical protein